VPADAALIVIAGPQGRFDPAEEELLRQYLSTRAGRVLALLAPMYPHGLDNLLFDWGVLADDVLIYDESPAGRSETGDLIFPAIYEHPVTQVLASYKIPLRFGPTRVIRLDPGRPLDANLVVSPLAATTPDAWGERTYRLRRTPQFDAGVDLGGNSERLTVATASERKPSSATLAAFSIPAGRLVTFGSADWIANGRLSTVGNLSLFLSAVNWTTDRDIDLNIPARPVQRFQLALTQRQLERLRYSLLFALPGAAAFLGFIVYWTRRR
jgi:ABC-type uncharacterized transport system involved in gliding motility auxiliary subunit